MPWISRRLDSFHIRRSITRVRTVECVWNDKKVKRGVGQGTADILQKLFSKKNTVSGDDTVFVIPDNQKKVFVIVRSVDPARFYSLPQGIVLLLLRSTD